MAPKATACTRCSAKGQCRQLAGSHEHLGPEAVRTQRTVPSKDQQLRTKGVLLLSWHAAASLCHQIRSLHAATFRQSEHT